MEFLIIFKAMWVLLRRNFGAIFLAVLLPFMLSHLVVLQAREMGMPYRLGLDIVHGAVVLSYLSVVVRLKFSGPAQFGFGFATPRWPGLSVLLQSTFAVVVIGLPIALALHPLTQALEGLSMAHGGTWDLVPTVMLPEFTITTLVGLSLAAALHKVER